MAFVICGGGGVDMTSYWEFVSLANVLFVGEEGNKYEDNDCMFDGFDGDM